jgi:hypothetical protein
MIEPGDREIGTLQKQSLRRRFAQIIADTGEKSLTTDVH